MIYWLSSQSPTSHPTTRTELVRPANGAQGRAVRVECIDPSEFRVTVAESGEFAALRLTGELDLATAETLRARLAPLLALDRVPPLMELLVDIGSLSFIDAAGLRVLVDARRVLVQRSGRLVLRRPSPLVRRILRLLDLQEDFDLR